MSYVKTTWAADVALTLTRLNNLASQYDEAYEDFENHNHDDLYYTKTEMDTKFWYNLNGGASSGMDADYLYCDGAIKHYDDFVGISVPIGFIMMWDSETLPDGWHICNGLEGTINLTDRFVVGAGTGGGYNVGNTITGTVTPIGTLTIGGHKLTADEVKGHQHTLTDFYATGNLHIYKIGRYSDNPTTTASQETFYTSVVEEESNVSAHSHTGSFTGIESDQIVPPCAVLYYIQKIS